MSESGGENPISQQEPLQEVKKPESLARAAANLIIDASPVFPGSVVGQGGYILRKMRDTEPDPKKLIAHFKDLRRELSKDDVELSRIERIAVVAHRRATDKPIRIRRFDTLNVVDFDFEYAIAMTILEPAELDDLLALYEAKYRGNDLAYEAKAEEVINAKQKSLEES